MSFTQQQLEAAYKQMEQERQTDHTYAQTAADLLNKALNGKQKVSAQVPSNRGSITPFTTDHVLTVQLSKEDDWDACINDLVAAGAQMKPWNNNFHTGPQGDFNVSGNTQFAGRAKQSYRVHIEYYDTY